MSIITTATATEMQNNFGRYLNLVLSGQEIIVTKNGKGSRPVYSKGFSDFLSHGFPDRYFKGRL